MRINDDTRNTMGLDQGQPSAINYICPGPSIILLLTIILYHIVISKFLINTDSYNMLPRTRISSICLNWLLLTH
jgi:hypothetical protein